MSAREFGEDYLPGMMAPFKPGPHRHDTLAGLTGLARSAGDGKHYHPTMDGATTLAEDTPDHTHELPSGLVTEKRETTR